MSILGITGGIGSGKSYISHIFHMMGIPVYDADKHTKNLYSINQDLILEIKKTFGVLAFTGHKIDKIKLASLVFSDREKLVLLEKIVYPYVLQDFHLWVEDNRKKSNNVVIIESAILLEKDVFKLLADKVLVVEAPLDIRQKRVILRDKTNLENVQQRMANQWTDQKRREFADYIINTDGTKPLLPQIENVYLKILND